MRFGKNVLSQNLRTNCDLALYFTLFTPQELERAGLPKPLDARPGVGSLRDAGIEQETAVYNRLRTAFGTRCIGAAPTGTGERWRDQPLADQLSCIRDIPAVTVQPKMELSPAARASALRRLGVAESDVDTIPRFEGFIPDLAIIRRAHQSDYELAPTGERLPIRGDDPRHAIAVVDVKHAQEANPSYEAEAVLYAVILSNWLTENGYADRFYVSANVYLWTRGGMGRGAFQQAIDRGITDPAELLDAVVAELDAVNVPIYVQSIRRFFAERIPAVVRTGAADWTSLEWHVGATCASCDWLGFEGWLSPRDRQRVAANPQHYCFVRADRSDHVSRLPLVTRGSRRVLENSGLQTIAQIANTSGNEDVYGQHTRLKSDRRSIPGFAVALATESTATDTDRVDGMLARYADLDLYLSINFDPGAGLLTAIGLQATFTQNQPFGHAQGERQRRRWRERWIVSAKSSEAEEGAVLAFLQQLATIFDHVTDTDPERGGPNAGQTRTQIIFWDRRQFQELCFALGRHLPAILYDRQDRLVRALAWLFPAEELQELDTIEERRPGIAFVRDTVRRLVRVPAAHALTLFNVAEHYHYGEEPFNPPDQFYREPLSDRIPRERIYELWSLSASGGGGVVRWGSIVKTHSQLMESFARTVDRQGNALSSITWRLRRDFGRRLKAEAPCLNLVVPTWMPRVSHDSKLWIAWSRFEAAFTRASRHVGFTADADETEASNEGLRLVRELGRNHLGEITFEISPDSVNSKLKAPDQYLCVSVDAIPGFLALPTWAVVPFDDLPQDLRRMANVPMHRLFGARLQSVDRVARTAVVRFAGFWGDNGLAMQRLRDEILQRKATEFNGSLTLLPSLGSDITVTRLEAILSEVGNPPIATPAPETLRALGSMARRVRTGTDPVTPTARVLWDADALNATEVRDAATCQRAVAHARQFSALNESQAAAVGQAASRALSVIWGPPGTGKTNTCAALVHGIVAAEVLRRRQYSILLSGPTYKAVGELVERVVSSLAKDPAVPCRLYLVYSKSRPDRFPLPAQVPDHVTIIEALSERTAREFQQMRDDLETGQGVVIVAAVTHQCARISEQFSRMTGAPGVMHELFDFVLIDETSQVDIATAVMPLALLKSTFQIVVAGDHLQMPPIVATEPPLGAEYLVGSLQRYLAERFRIEPTPLLLNYRSNQNIVDYIRRLGYPPELQAAYPQTAIALLEDPAGKKESMESAGLPWSDGWLRIVDPERPIVGVTYPDGTAGQANVFEARCVVSVVWLLRQCSSRFLAGRPDTPEAHEPWTDEGFWTEGVGIVTPHRAQRAQVVRELMAAFPNVDPLLIEGAVDTVERFQGGQRHTILISFGVGDPDVIRGEERFLLQLERTNVALSRAMGKCIVFLSDDVANHIPDDRDAAATAHALRGVIDEWCIHRQSAAVEFEGRARTLTVRWR